MSRPTWYGSVFRPRWFEYFRSRRSSFLVDFPTPPETPVVIDTFPIPHVSYMMMQERYK